MVMELKANGYESFLNGSRDDHFQGDNVDPMYKMFLEHLRKDGKSYILEMEDGDNGLPVFVKYENNAGLSDFLRLDAPISSGHCSFVRNGRFKAKKRRICKKSEAQSNGIVEFSGFLSNHHIENMLAVDSNEEFRSFRNRSADSFKNQAESNLADDSYQQFLSCLKIQDGLMVLEYNSITIIYEGHETSAVTEGTCFDGQGSFPLQAFESTQPADSLKPANEGASCSDNRELVLYETNPPPDVVNLCNEGAYQPWMSASSKIVEVSDHETMLPLGEKNMEAQTSPSSL